MRLNREKYALQAGKVWEETERAVLLKSGLHGLLGDAPKMTVRGPFCQAG